MGGDYSSPIMADGKIYYVSRNGDAFVLKPGDKLDLTQANSAKGYFQIA